MFLYICWTFSCGTDFPGLMTKHVTFKKILFWFISFSFPSTPPGAKGWKEVFFGPLWTTLWPGAAWCASATDSRGPALEPGQNYSRNTFPLIYFLTHRCLSVSCAFTVAKNSYISFVFEINCLKSWCQIASFFLPFIQIDSFIPGKSGSWLLLTKSLELVKETQDLIPIVLNTTNWFFLDVATNLSNKGQFCFPPTAASLLRTWVWSG